METPGASPCDERKRERRAPGTQGRGVHASEPLARQIGSGVQLAIEDAVATAWFPLQNVTVTVNLPGMVGQ